MQAQQSFAAWFLSSAALIVFAVSWWPQPAAAATSQAPATRLVIRAAAQRHLLALYAAYRHIPVPDIARAAPGSVLGARLPRSGEDWAMIHWELSSRAAGRAAAGFQDGAGTAVFTRAPGGAWTVAGVGGEPAGCAVRVPQAVRRSWHLASCPALETPSSPPASRAAAGATGTLVRIALAQVGVSDNPAVTSFSGPDCDPYTTLVGNPLGASGRYCKTSSNGTYFHNVQDVSEFWCADFTKWVWKQAGVTSSLGVLTPSAATFYTWGTDHGEHITFGGTPKVGEAVLLYPPGTKAPDGSYADHVGIVTAVHADGTVNLVNGDFLGPSNISVQYNTNARLSTWASQVEGNNGEEWAFVSPLLKARAPQPAGSAPGRPAAGDFLSGNL
jgi:hypothetical protein